MTLETFCRLRCGHSPSNESASDDRVVEAVVITVPLAAAPAAAVAAIRERGNRKHRSRLSNGTSIRSYEMQKHSFHPIYADVLTEILTMTFHALSGAIRTEQGGKLVAVLILVFGLVQKCRAFTAHPATRRRMASRLNVSRYP